jgi:hypothetical protein
MLMQGLVELVLNYAESLAGDSAGKEKSETLWASLDGNESV